MAVRTGIIGTSWWAENMYLSSLQNYPQAQLVAICGRNRERADEIAEKYGIPEVYTDYHDLLSHSDLDAVIISSPDDLHYPMTMAALDAGLHVLCEKPLASTAAQAKEMYEKAEAKKLKTMVLFTYRFLPVFRYVHDLVQSGYIGRPYQAQFHMTAGFFRNDQYLWRMDQNRANGVLGDLGSHLIDLARWYLGDVAKVTASLGTFVERQGPEGQPLKPANDSASLLLEFSNGAQGVAQVSYVTHLADIGAKVNVTLYGEDGTLEGEFNFFGPTAGGVVHGARHNEENYQKLEVPDELYGDTDRTNILSVFTTQSVGSRAFIDAIYEDRPVSPTFYDGLKAQEVIDAALESHQTGKWMTLEKQLA